MTSRTWSGCLPKAGLVRQQIGCCLLSPSLLSRGSVKFFTLLWGLQIPLSDCHFSVASSGAVISFHKGLYPQSYESL